MYNHRDNQLLHVETTCGSLLSELQKIWGEVGEPDTERDKMILELEQECLEAYRKKVDQANRYRARLRQTVADSEAELAYICAALGDRPVHKRQFENNTGSLKKELEAIMPQLEDMRKRKSERRSQFVEVLNQICNISKEIYRSTDDNLYMKVIDESDLSLNRLDELHGQLLALEKEKSDRLKQVLNHLNTLNQLCVVLGMDFKQTISEIHPTLIDSSSTKNISADTLERLSAVICSLKEVKIHRMQKIQDFATTMVEMWSLMDTPVEEQKMFQSVTRNIAASENEITEPNTLSLDFINFAEAEVLRLQQMKSRKIKEVILKKRLNLEELCKRAHMAGEAHSAVDYSVEAIESGAIDTSYLLEQIEIHISKVKEEAFSRKDILEKVEKWLAACEEECWLEEYNRDDTRYNAGRGTHLILKRAEKARALLSKIPAMVEALSSKTRSWEKERGVEFSYDGVSLLSMIEQYSILKQEKEQERQRQKDQKRIQGQLIAEQEVLFGSKPSPSKSVKKNSRMSTSMGGASNKKIFGGVMLQTPNAVKASLSSRAPKKSNSVKKHYARNPHPIGYLGALSSGKRDLNNTDVPAAQHFSKASSAHEIESMPTRKPLSPVSSAFSPSNNAANIQDENLIQNGSLQKALPSNKTPAATPTKIISAVDGENKTPRTMPVPMPSTPKTVSVAMQTAMTPAAPCVPCGPQEIEYSFEEIRVGFVLPKQV